MGKTNAQIDREVKQEERRLRLLGKSREVLAVLKDETSRDAIDVLNFLVSKINRNLQIEAEVKVIKDICQEDFKELKTFIGFM